jgi:hypothetical protein
MKLIIVVYHEQYDSRVKKIVNEELPIPRYTQLDNVTGAGSLSPVEIYRTPGLKQNRMLLIVQADDMIGDIMARFKQLHDELGHGLRAFVLPMEEVV